MIAQRKLPNGERLEDFQKVSVGGMLCRVCDLFYVVEMQSVANSAVK